MANPQKENGYTIISNELLEALARIRIPGESRQVLDMIIRFTYGFNRKTVELKLNTISTFVKMRRQNVRRAIDTLIIMNIIRIKKTQKRGIKKDSCSDVSMEQTLDLQTLKKGIKKDSCFDVSYSLNKDYESWRPRPCIKRGIKKDSSTPKRGIKKDSCYIGKEKSFKERDTAIESSNGEFKIQEYFKNEFQKRYNSPYHFLAKEKRAAQELLSTHGELTILDLVDLYFDEVENDQWLKSRCNFTTFNFKVNDLAIKLAALKDESGR